MLKPNTPMPMPQTSESANIIAVPPPKGFSSSRETSSSTAEPIRVGLGCFG